MPTDQHLKVNHKFQPFFITFLMCIWCLQHTPSFNGDRVQTAPISQGFTYYGLEVLTL